MMESNVQYYSTVFPDTFIQAKSSYLYSKSGRKFIDFFSAAGALNYGHNNPQLIESLIKLINNNSLLCSLDMNTPERDYFLHKFNDIILKPNGIEYKIQFTGPTGTNAIEAALKLARKYTGRRQIVAFSGSFHGMTMGSMTVSSNAQLRQNIGLASTDVTFIPYPVGPFSDNNTLKHFENSILDPRSGIEKPAAVIVENIQGEGGVLAAPKDFVVKLREICTRYKILLICDDVQVGCGRSGSFFSAQKMGVWSDIIVLSKSLSGLGLPLSILLIKPQLDCWEPGEHNGTFRGNQMAIASAASALDFWEDLDFQEGMKTRSSILKGFLKQLETHSDLIKIRGRGMIWGISFEESGKDALGLLFVKQCYKNGIILEACGRKNGVVKLMPSLNIPINSLQEALERLKHSLLEIL